MPKKIGIFNPRGNSISLRVEFEDDFTGLEPIDWTVGVRTKSFAAALDNPKKRDEHKIFMAEHNLKKKEHEDFLSSLDEDSRFTEEYIKPYLAKCEFIEKTCKKNKTKYTRYTCLCKCVINFASNSPLSYEKHILLPTHINIFKKFEHLIKDINLNPIPRDRQEISQFYRVSR
jgi:hypothetical protein